MGIYGKERRSTNDGASVSWLGRDDDTAVSSAFLTHDFNPSQDETGVGFLV
jgi:hypothetical protein